MSGGDSFSVLIKTEKEAAEIIKKAKEARKMITLEQERALESEIEIYRKEEENRIKAEQQRHDAAEGNKGQEEEIDTANKITEIANRQQANMEAMVKTLVTMVTTVN